MSILTISLEDLHALGSLLPLATIVSYLTAITTEIQPAHTRGVVHGALSPTNIMLSNGAIVVSNFGGIQQPTYMAPEQFLGEVTPASDQYALGILVYQWLSGTLPFQGHDLEAQHRSAPVPSLKKRLPTIPARVERVVLRALAKDPQDRYPTVEAFAAAFAQALLPDASPAPTRTPGGQVLQLYQFSRRWHHRSPIQGLYPGKRGNRILLSACSLIAALLVMLIGWLAGEAVFPPQPVEMSRVQVHPTPHVRYPRMIVPSPTPTPALQRVPFALSASVSSASSSLYGITLDTYTNENITHDLTQQETDGMILTFTNVSSPCQNVTFPAGSIADSTGNSFGVPDIHLPCNAPTTSVKVAGPQYSQTGTFPTNALYAITEQLLILPEDPASVLARVLGQEEQNAAAQFSTDATGGYPSLQFQEQDVLCVHTDPDVANGYLSIMKVACATFLLDPSQLPSTVRMVEQEHNPAIRTCTVATATLDTHDSFITFDGAYNPIVSLLVTLKGTCTLVA